jgi:MFS family permease
MSVTAYRHVLALPGVLRLLAFAVLARIPSAASSVVITLFVVQGLGRGYAEAGFVAAVSTIGIAIGGPWRGRALDRIGLRRAILPSVVVEGVAWSCMPLLGYREVLVAAFVAGLLAVPIYTVVRQSLSVLVPASGQRGAFTLDSIGTELSFMVGPTAGVLLASLWSSTGAVVVLGVATALAGVFLMVANPPLLAADPPPAGGLAGIAGPADPESRLNPPVARERTEAEGPVRTSLRRSPGPDRGWRESRRMLLDPRMLTVLAATGAAVMVLAATDVSVVAYARADDRTHLVWIVFTLWSASSMVGGLILGALRRTVPVYVQLLALGLLTIPIGLVPDTRWLVLAIIPSGFLNAPVLSATATTISRLVPEHRRGEAMGWYGSAMTLGIAIGTPLAGAAIDGVGPWAGFALLGSVGVVVAVIGLALIPCETDRPNSEIRSGEQLEEFGAPSGVSPTRRQAVST